MVNGHGSKCQHSISKTTQVNLDTGLQLFRPKIQGPGLSSKSFTLIS